MPAHLQDRVFLRLTAAAKKHFLIALARRRSSLKVTVSAKALADLVGDHERMATKLMHLGCTVEHPAP